MIKKNIFGFEVKVKEDLNLTLPSKSTFKLLRTQCQFRNKDFFWNSIKPIVACLPEFRTVIWAGEPEMQRIADEVTKNILIKKETAPKDIMVDFYCYLYGEDSNISSIAKVLMTNKGFKIAKLIVEKGALCLTDLPEIMSWVKYKANQWSNNMDTSTLKRWQSSKDTAPLAMMTDILSGAAQNISSPKNFYTPIYPYIIPNYLLIQYVTQKNCPSLVIKDIPSPQLQGMVLFSGEDLFGNENTLQNLIISKVLPAGKVKIGITTVRKLNSFIILNQFPDNKVMSRSEYVANAAFLMFGEPSDMEFPKNMVPDKTFLKGMFGNIQITSRYYLMTVLANSARNLAHDFFYLNKKAFADLFAAVIHNLIEAYRLLDKGWISYDSFCKRANYQLTLTHHGYIYPDHYTLKPEAVKDVSGKLMPPTDFKQNIHDVILRAMVEGMAAIGGIDLLYDKKKNLSYLRLSEAGKWYVGIANDVPKSKSYTNPADSIEVDDQTGLITVKNQDYPYINMLLEVADKITDTRYCLSEKAFLKKCDSPEMLEAKINRFKVFILPHPEPNIAHRLEKMMANCNLVNKTEGDGMFQLFDIDPKNSRLHNLILDNKEIRKNSLRVEGCRLLVKSKFLPRFFEILSENGFLNRFTL